MTKDILIINSSDMTSYYNGELLAHLQDCQDIRFGDTINFATNTRFEGDGQSRVMDAFNVYLQHLSRTVSRIIINLR